MVCSSCGTANEPGRKFCKACASRLALVCSACGSPNAADARYCGECAAALGTESPGSTGVADARAATVPTAERRLVSVLFADLVGFTPFAEERDAEAVRETLTRYFTVASDVVERYGGTVEKFIGDAVMAVWGAPTAHEDDAERAVRAALELVEAVRSVGPGVVARAAVMTGEAAVTVGATNQGMVAGDLVNTASRLQGVAEAGAVLVGEATHRAASRAIAFEPAGEHALKGRDAPVAAWRALRVVAEVGGKNRADTLEAPFVGRDEELRLLKELFHGTARERRVKLVSITAPAGHGKSRLAWEFSKYIDGLVEPVWWHAGRSPAYGEGITFWALGEMIRERSGLAESDDPETTRQRIRATVDEWIADPDEREWIGAALLALLGAETSTIGPEQLFGAWRTFFERIARRGPVVLLFEDLQWADAGVLDFIDNMLEWSRGAPIFIVTLARPELFDRRDGWPSAARNSTSMTLEPLPETAMRELLVGLIPGLPDRAVEAIVTRAEGIPLYAVETVRMLVADRRLVREDGLYRPVGDLRELAVPETLTALITARLDSLKADERRLVADASVLGQSFSKAALGAVSEVELPALDAGLRSLVRHEILTVEADPRSPERGQYAFVQALIREVAYATLARRDRRSRHLAAARYFESLGSDELVAALAGHYLAAHAHSAAGPEADAVAAQGRVTLRAAAERARSLGSHVQAVAFLEQALAITTEPSDTADLLERAGGSTSDAGQHEAAEAFLRRAVDIRRRLGDPAAIARSVALLGDKLLLGFRVGPGRELLEAASSELTGLDAHPSMVTLRGRLARALLLEGRDAAAIAMADQVLVAAERLDLVPIVADTLVTKGGALADSGRNYEGIALIEAGLALAEAHGLKPTALRAMSNLVASHIPRDPVAAVAISRRALPEARRLSLATWVLSLVANGTEAAMWTGEWDWAMDEADEVSRQFSQPDVQDRVFLLTAILPIRSWRGEPIDAELAELEQLAPQVDDPDGKSTIHSARSHVALAAGRFERALSEALERGALSPINAAAAFAIAARAALWMGDSERAAAALAALDATGTHGPAITHHRTTITAGIAALEGRVDESLAGYRQAMAGWRQAGLPVLEALTAIDMAAVLDPSARAVREAEMRAREILVGLGARALLERLDAALARSGARTRPQGEATPV